MILSIPVIGALFAIPVSAAQEEIVSARLVMIGPGGDELEPTEGSPAEEMLLTNSGTVTHFYPSPRPASVSSWSADSAISALEKIATALSSYSHDTILPPCETPEGRIDHLWVVSYQRAESVGRVVYVPNAFGYMMQYIENPESVPEPVRPAILALVNLIEADKNSRPSPE